MRTTTNKAIINAIMRKFYNDKRTSLYLNDRIDAAQSTLVELHVTDIPTGFAFSKVYRILGQWGCLWLSEIESTSMAVL